MTLTFGAKLAVAIFFGKDVTKEKLIAPHKRVLAGIFATAIIIAMLLIGYLEAAGELPPHDNHADTIWMFVGVVVPMMLAIVVLELISIAAVGLNYFFARPLINGNTSRWYTILIIVIALIITLICIRTDNNPDLMSFNSIDELTVCTINGL